MFEVCMTLRKGYPSRLLIKNQPVDYLLITILSQLENWWIVWVRRLAAFKVPVLDMYWSYPLNLPFESVLKSLQVKYLKEQWWMVKWLMRVVETSVFGTTLVMCLRRQMRISTRTVYCVNVVDGGGGTRRWRRCCMRPPPVAVRSSPSLTCGSQNRMLETWQQRLPGSCWTGFPSPHHGNPPRPFTWPQPCGAMNHTPTTNLLLLPPPFAATWPQTGSARLLFSRSSQSCLPNMHVLIFLSRSPAFLFILLRPPVCCRCWRFSTTCPCLLLTKLLFLVMLG